MGADLTSGGPPDVVVEFSSAWLQLRLDDDTWAWTRAAARRAWESAAMAPTAADVELLAAELEVLGRVACAAPRGGAFVLCPDPAEGPRAVVRLGEVRYPAGTGSRVVVDDLLLPAEQQLLPPRVELVAGPGLGWTRVRQRAWSSRTDALSDHIAYVFGWDEGAWVLSTAIPDPREAERCLPELDELAAGVRLQGHP